jgi:CRP-like cAMP-binding protein
MRGAPIEALERVPLFSDLNKDFGEIALIDDGTRMATITAASELFCYGITYWDFRPLVEKNGVIGWKLLQQMSKMLRATRQEANELDSALATLRR